MTDPGAMPIELREALEADPKAEERFTTLSPSHRREYAEWVGRAKRHETRRRRAARAMEMLSERS